MKIHSLVFLIFLYVIPVASAETFWREIPKDFSHIRVSAPVINSVNCLQIVLSERQTIYIPTGGIGFPQQSYRSLYSLNSAKFYRQGKFDLVDVAGKAFKATVAFDLEKQQIAVAALFQGKKFLKKYYYSSKLNPVENDKEETIGKEAGYPWADALRNIELKWVERNKNATPISVRSQYGFWNTKFSDGKRTWTISGRKVGINTHFLAFTTGRVFLIPKFQECLEDNKVVNIAKKKLYSELTGKAKGRYSAALLCTYMTRYQGRNRLHLLVRYKYYTCEIKLKIDEKNFSKGVNFKLGEKWFHLAPREGRNKLQKFYEGEDLLLTLITK